MTGAAPDDDRKIRMPELPEVEIYKRYVDRHALNQKIVSISVHDARILSAVTGRGLHKSLSGSRFLETFRHGKHLFVRSSRPVWLHLHFGMSGDLAYYKSPAATPRFARVIFHFAGEGHLAYEDMRLFGRVGLSRDPQKTIRERRLGVDPLDPDFREKDFVELMKKRRGAIKALLMRQDLIAGMGNLYVDEALFQAGILPRRNVQTLSDKQLEKLFTRARAILTSSIRRKSQGRGNPPGSLIRHRAQGDECPRCRGMIERDVVAGRTTYYCHDHQG